MDLHFKTYGKGDPVVILHGLFGMLDNWKSFAKQLGEDYMVILPDQRNHGRSPRAGEISYPILAQDLEEFLREQWIFKAHIMGHSMGGKTAMQFALDYPDMTHSLISVDMAPRAYNAHHQEIFKALRSVPVDDISERKEAREILEEQIDEQAVVQFLLKNLKRKKAGGYEWKMNLPVLYHQYDKILEAITSSSQYEGSALFVRGGRSDYITEGDEEEIKRLFPRADLLTIEKAGHWIHSDRADALLESVRQFLHEAESKS